MNYQKIKKLFTLTLLYLLLALPTNSVAQTYQPWETKNEEITLEGLYLGYKKNLILIKIKNNLVEYPYSSEALFALMGRHSGRLVALPHFPRELPVQIILDQNSTIRAMRNKLQPPQYIRGNALEEWGHFATLSPSEKNYTLFDLWQGLHLYNLEKKETPVFLSNIPLCTWNNQGSEIAYVLQDNLCIYNLSQNSKKIYFYPRKGPRLIRVITSIAWSPLDTKLLYTYLEDYPQQGSDVFQITVMDKKGAKLAAKIYENIGPTCWLSEDKILLVLNPHEQKAGKFIIWDYRTNKTTTLFDNIHGTCNNLCYNQQSSSLAFTMTKAEDWQEELYLYKFTPDKKPQKIKSLVSPIHNLQWTKDHTLIFWEEFNNMIKVIKENGEVIKMFTGYLPEKGAAKKCLYFLEEPKEEPLPLYLSP